MTEREQAAWCEAVAEGLSYFTARTFAVEQPVRFVARCWEEGGYVERDGEPVADGRGNAIAFYAVEPLDARFPAHVAQVCEWYYGD